MKKYLFIFLFVAFFSTNLTAKEIKLYVPFKPGGLSGKLAEHMVAIDKKLFKIDYLGNCKIGEIKFKNKEGELYVLALAYTVMGDCIIGIEEQNIVDIVYSQSLSMCYQRSRTELGKEHFLNPAKKKKLIVLINFKGVTNTWMKELGLESNAKVINGGVAASILSASFTNEGDYFLLDTTTAVKHKDRLSCLFNTGKNYIEEIDAPALGKFSKNIKHNEVYNSQIMITPFPEKQEEYSSIIKNLKNKQEWKELTADPGIMDKVDTYIGEFYQKQKNILLENKE